MFNNILVVCMGNICRSPTGERLLQAHFPNKKVHSAGIIAKDDRPAYESAIRIAQQHNLCLNNHQSRRLTSELCKEADLILVMENDHIDRIHQQFPETRGKSCYSASGLIKPRSQIRINAVMKCLNMFIS